MRALLCSVLFLPGVAMADTIAATSRVTAVTIYPQGAQVTREVVFSAPAGVHDLLVTDLPLATEPGLMKLASGDVELGAFALRDDRLPPQEEVISPDELAAEEEVRLARVALHGAQQVVAGIHAEVEAQEAQIKFLTGVKVNDGTATAEAVSAMSQMIGTEVLTARMAALAAQSGLAQAEEDLQLAQDDLARAEGALEALAQRAEDYAALSVAVTTKGGEGHVTVTHYVADAGWLPVYDLALDRKAGKVAVTRGVVVHQYAGEDWQGVDLTLSTARPSEQSEPSQLWPWLRRIEEPQDQKAVAMDLERSAEGEEMPLAEAAAPMESAAMDYQGDTVIYPYPAKVDLASGVEDLRLKLGDLALTAKVQAQAVPRLDATAFLVAEVVNDSAEILLPGEVFLYRDGALTGMTQLALLAPGDDLRLGFGPIDGIRLKRDMPLTSEGERGIITSSNRIEERAVLEVENLTGEAWPVRVLDMVPYSEQEELEISFTADPPVSEADVEGQRGILAWDFDLGPGERKEITLESVMSWPEGKVLQ